MDNYFKCRLCLEESNRNVEIFKEDFPQMIELLTGLKVEPSDGLPKTSCLQCYKEVKSAMLTRYQIITSHNIFLQELNSAYTEASDENVMNVVNSMKKEVSSSSNDSIVISKNITLKNEINMNNSFGDNFLTSDIENNSIFLPTFTETNTEPNPKLEAIKVKKDPESENFDTDKQTGNYVENKISDDSLSSTDADNLIANAEDIIKAVKSNPSSTEERAFKKLIKSLQSTSGRARKSLKRNKPYSCTKKKKKEEETNKTECRKKRIPKEIDDIYRVKVNYDLKPEHLKYLRSVGRRTRATCPVCSRQMNGMNLKSHLIAHTYDPTPCPICGKTSKNAQALQDHINYSHRTAPDRFICDQCGKGFKVSYSLEKHRNREHQGPRERPFECHVCGKRFYENSIQALHRGLEYTPYNKLLRLLEQIFGSAAT